MSVLTTRLLSRCLAIFVVILALFCSNPIQAMAQPQSIVIGMSAAFTGTSSELGLELYHGSMAYIDQINQSGGINGYPIIIKAYDDGYNPLPAIENTIHLIADHQVFLLFNYVGTPTVTRILPLLKKYQDDPIFLLFPFTGAQPHRQYPYNQLVFNIRASYQEETAGLVEHFLEIGRRRIAVFYQIDAYGRSGWDGVRQELEKHGLNIVGEATYRRGTEYTQSFQNQVKILQEAEPDAIISIGSYQACAGFIRDARDANWNIPIANISFVGSESLLKLLLNTGKSNNKDYTKNLINSQVFPSYNDISLPIIREYRHSIDTYQGQHPISQETYESLGYNFVSLEGFINAKVLVEILKRLPDLENRHLVDDTINSIQEIELGLKNPIKFSTTEHQGLHQVYYTTIKNNQFVPLINWKQWKK